ncbi:signal peptide peptidase SppA [Candidatus Pacearchaeota archaeon]|jgi:signal peptide peptidase SppA|nr:signal peptide peptidase SppA [Candidatus Pacearchaeota archaeon]
MRLLDIMTAPWAIVPSKLQEIRGIYMTHMKGDKIDIKSAEPIERTADTAYSVDGGVAVIEIANVLTKSRTFFSWLFGGTSMRDIGDAFQSALDDTDVHSIVLAIDSPGGTVDGTEELASRIRAARGTKPVVAVADGIMASAAYWIGAAADRIYIAGNTTEVGSIGVVASHVDVSEQDKMFGEKYTEVTAGKYKRIASSHKPLSEEGRAYMQDQVDQIYYVFVQTVADYRGRSVEQILEAADGRVFIGQTAVDVGLVDGVSTLAETIKKLQEENLMDLNELKTKHPSIYQAAYAEGKAAGIVEGVDSGKQAGLDIGRAEGVKEGAKAEQERIRAVEGALIPGHEAMIEAFKADGKTTGAEAMAAVIAAENRVRAAEKTKLDQDAIKPAAAAAAPSAAAEAAAASAAEDTTIPVEERAKSQWDKDAKIRAEFRTLETYTAFKKAEEAGRVKILGRK